MFVSLKKIIFVLMIFSGMLLSWEVTSRMVGELRFILPSPSQILECLWKYSDRFLLHSFVTCKEMLGGFVIAFMIAFPLAYFMVLWRTLRMVLQPLFIVIQCVPMFTLAPLMVLWFDWSYTAIIIPTALMIFFPLTMSIYQGIKATPKHYLDYFRHNRATSWQIFTKLQLPWSLPHLFAGIRISAAIAGIGAVAGEWAGGQNGLGVLMLESRRSADITMTFGALVCLTFVSLVFYFSATTWEKWVLKRKRMLLSVLNGLVLMLICGCQSGGREKGEVRLVLDWFPNPNHIPIYVGIERGFFNENGIPLKVYKMHDPSDAIPFVLSGQAELGITYMPHAVKSIEMGASITPVGILIKQPLNALLYRKGEGIENPQDLTGKVMGYCVDGSSRGVLDYLLKNGAIVPSAMRNVNFDLVAMLGTKRVDAIYGAYWNVEGEHLRALGIDTDYFSLNSLGLPNYYELIFIAKQHSPQCTEEFIRQWQMALQYSIDYAVANPDEAFRIYAASQPDKTEETLAWEKKCWEKTCPVLSVDQEINQDEWNTFAHWLNKVVTR